MALTSGAPCRSGENPARPARNQTVGTLADSRTVVPHRTPSRVGTDPAEVAGDAAELEPDRNQFPYAIMPVVRSFRSCSRRSDVCVCLAECAEKVAVEKTLMPSFYRVGRNAAKKAAAPAVRPACQLNAAGICCPGKSDGCGFKVVNYSVVDLRDRGQLAPRTGVPRC